MKIEELWLLATLSVLGCTSTDSTATRTPPCAAYVESICPLLDKQSCASLVDTLKLTGEKMCIDALADIEAVQATVTETRANCDRIRVADCDGLTPAQCENGVMDEISRLTVFECAALGEDERARLVERARALDGSAPAEDEEDVILYPATASTPLPSLGPQAAPVVLTAFVDFECGSCVNSMPEIEKIVSWLTPHVRAEFRQLPLEELHPSARAASEASLEANAQGRFWPFVEGLVAQELPLDDGKITRAAEVAGLDMVAFHAARTERRHRAAVDVDLDLAEKGRIDFTPAVFVNGEPAPNVFLPLLERVAKEVRARAERAEREHGLNP